MFDYPLPPLPKTLYDELGLPPEAPEADVRAAAEALDTRLTAERDRLRVQIDEADKAATEADPTLSEWRRRHDEVIQQIIALHGANLQKPEERAKYDEGFPPAALLKVEPPPDPFADAATMLAVVRREVGAFLEARGVGVGHPSDLARVDFRGDFAANPELDGG